ncbi:MAG: hypothetical protein F6J90_29885 [Moorea sp. SIOASIH]|uniref:hypothetical protein n=1 Tax=Moorena sp. SIOASIH TaxID=2607817 RepID=UPI0013B9E402|nr:hypothetical protein [Moorena sp. SIOASIH]NEO40330.1 hypothetical protein [Moorena sp. SIOASIH]
MSKKSNIRKALMLLCATWLCWTVSISSAKAFYGIQQRYCAIGENNLCVEKIDEYPESVLSVENWKLSEIETEIVIKALEDDAQVILTEKPWDDSKEEEREESYKLSKGQTIKVKKVIESYGVKYVTVFGKVRVGVYDIGREYTEDRQLTYEEFMKVVQTGKVI